MTPKERAARYLAKLPAAVAGQRGHDAAYRAACVLVRQGGPGRAGFGLSESDALDLLREDFNPRCLPPWSERELLHKVRSAAGGGRASPKRTPARGAPLRLDWSNLGTAAALPEAVADWPEDARETWEERAGIMECDGETGRPAAEAAAAARVRAEWARKART